MLKETEENIGSSAQSGESPVGLLGRHIHTIVNPNGDL